MSLMITLPSFLLHADDLGVKGRLFDVIEIDFRAFLIQSAHDNVDMDEIKREMIDDSRKFYRELPNFHLPISKAYVEKFIDPTRVYEDDFWNLKKGANGKFVWYKMVDAGTEVNWLKGNVAPFPIYVVFDFQSSAQKKFFKDVFDLVVNPYFVPVFTGGDISEVNKYFDRPITYLNHALINEYDIEYTPTIVKRGDGSNINNYKVTRFDIEEMSPEVVASMINGDFK